MADINDLMEGFRGLLANDAAVTNLLGASPISSGKSVYRAWPPLAQQALPFIVLDRLSDIPREFNLDENWHEYRLLSVQVTLVGDDPKSLDQLEGPVDEAIGGNQASLDTTVHLCKTIGVLRRVSPWRGAPVPSAFTASGKRILARVGDFEFHAARKGSF